MRLPPHNLLANGVGQGEEPPKVAKLVPSPRKLMVTFFWDSQGIILVDYLPHQQTMIGQYYAELIRKLRAAVKEKRRGMLSRNVLLLHDNARVHTCGVSMEALKEAGFEALPHPPYFPDLAPSDYHLFSYLKRYLRVKVFNQDDNNIIDSFSCNA